MYYSERAVQPGHGKSRSLALRQTPLGRRAMQVAEPESDRRVSPQDPSRREALAEIEILRIAWIDRRILLPSEVRIAAVVYGVALCEEAR